MDESSIRSVKKDVQGLSARKDMNENLVNPVSVLAHAKKN